jgi:N-acetylmuramoyl-L-alanine amidase
LRKKAPWILLMLIVAAGIGYWNMHKQPPAKKAKPGPEAVICIDPGHPSPRASGMNHQNGTTELEINWQVSHRLADILEKDPRIEVVMTRRVMAQVTSNPDRAIVANEAKADLAIHLHCDAGPSRGFTVYYPDKEGKAEGRKGPSKEVRAASSSAADAVHSALVGDLGGLLHDRGIWGDSHTRVGRMNGGLTTSIWSEVPTVTVEMVFLSNKSDAEFIKSEGGQEKMANALADGVMEYLYSTKALQRTR